MKNLMKKSKKGFTLMEMLIVVAIIAILVVIAIPTFTNALNEARANTDLANTRAWYAEMVVEAMLNEGSFDGIVTAGTYTNASTSDPWASFQSDDTSVDVAISGDDNNVLTVSFTNKHHNNGTAVVIGG